MHVNIVDQLLISVLLWNFSNTPNIGHFLHTYVYYLNMQPELSETINPEISNQRVITV